MLMILFACAQSPVGGETAEPVQTTPFALRGAQILTPEGVVTTDMVVSEGKITLIGTADATLSVHDVSGRWVVPAFIDSHVHLAYLPEGSAMADGGVAGVVDLAAPESFLTQDHAPLIVLASGPMITAVGGYPTQGWGSAGYGLECADAAAATSGVSRLVAAGAGVIKLPVTGDGEDQLGAAALAAAVAEADRLGVRVVSHALSDDEAARAAAAGVDALAHTPTETLSDTTLNAWRAGAVISTLTAFGNGSAARANLTALRAAGTTVLYGTDFGNAREAGINASEIAALQQAGLDGEAILAAGTSAPAAYWGLSDLGSLAPGKAASFLVLGGDPRADPGFLTRPVEVYINGVRR